MVYHDFLRRIELLRPLYYGSLVFLDWQLPASKSLQT
jgi:hypothetical protein